MTGTGESLADTHIHMNRNMEAGGATLGFTVLWYYPVSLPDRRPAARREREGGERHSTSRLERDARKKAQPSLPLLYQAHPSANMSQWNKHACLRPWSDVFQCLCSISYPPTRSIILQGPEHTLQDHTQPKPHSKTQRCLCNFTVHTKHTYTHTSVSRPCLPLHFSGYNPKFLQRHINMDAFTVS